MVLPNYLFNLARAASPVRGPAYHAFRIERRSQRGSQTGLAYAPALLGLGSSQGFFRPFFVRVPVRCCHVRRGCVRVHCSAGPALPGCYYLLHPVPCFKYGADLLRHPFFLDILGGWILGFFLLAVFLLAAPKAEEYAGRLSRPARLALFVFVSAIPILLVVPAYLSLGGWQVPAPWIEQALQQTGAVIHPDRIQYAWGAAGIIFGSLFGYEFLKSRGGWSPPADLKQRAGVVFAGTTSVLLVNMEIPGVWVYLGITALSPQLAVFLSMAGVIFWLMAGVPSLAAKAGFTK